MEIPKRCCICGSHEVFTNQTNVDGKTSYFCKKCDKDKLRVTEEANK